MGYSKLTAFLAAALLFSAGSFLEAKTKRSTSSTRAAKSRKGKAAKASRKAGPARQSAPSQARYAEIQRALAEKGYYTGAVTGEWGPESVEALKRFQRDQKLNDAGKLDSLTLIALGLGPKREPIGDVAVRPTSEPPLVP